MSRVQLRAVLMSTVCGLALASCGDPPAGTATGAMSGSSFDSEGTDASVTGGTTEGMGGSATSGATTGSASDPTVSDSGSGGSGTGASGSTGGAETGSTGEETPGIAELCAAGEDAAEEVDMFRCGCDVQAGLYPSMEACLDKQSQEQLTPGCSCEVYAEHPVEAAFIACNSEAVANLAKCLNKMTCADEPGQGLCVDIYFDALEKCGSPTKETTAQIEIQCGGAVPILCGSGEAVPIHWVCDGEVDCADMSDEADCFYACGDGQLVGKLDRCDGEYDCMNGADEKGCEP